MIGVKIKKILFLVNQTSSSDEVNLTIRMLSQELVNYRYSINIACTARMVSFTNVTTYLIRPLLSEIQEIIDNIRPEYIIAISEPFIEMLPQICGNWYKIAYEYDYSLNRFNSGNLLNKNKPLDQNVYNSLHGVLVGSHFTASEIGLDNAKVILNGINHIPPKWRATKYKTQSASLKIGTLFSNLNKSEEYSEYLLCLEIFSEIMLYNHNIDLYVMCNEEDLSYFSRLQGINIIVNKNDEAKWQFFHELDMFISFNEYSTTNMEIIEAMACGTPAWAFDTSLHPEITPFIFTSTNELLSICQQYTKDRSLLVRHALNAQKFVLERFNWSTAVKKLDTFLKELTIHKKHKIRKIKIQNYFFNIRNLLSKNNRLILSSGFFDTKYYIENNPELKNMKISPLSHYLKDGWKNQRNPSEFFDVNYYLNHNADILSLGIEPLGHYVLYGRKENRLPQACAMFDGLNPLLRPYSTESNTQRVSQIPNVNNIYKLPKKDLKSGLSIIILNLDHPEYIIPLVKNLEMQKTKFLEQHIGFEIIIGDTGSTDNEVLQFYIGHELNVIRGLKYNFSRNNNQLISNYASFDTILLLNNDIVFDNNSEVLWKMYNNLDQNKNTGIIGHVLLFPDKTIQHCGVDFLSNQQVRGLCFHPKKHEVMPSCSLYPMNVEAVTGAILMVKLDLYIKVGGLNEQYKKEFQDVALCLNVKRIGYKVEIHNFGEVIHLENGTRPRQEEEWSDRQKFLRQWGAYLEVNVFDKKLYEF